MKEAVLLLGGDLGPVVENLHRAGRAIATRCGRVLAQSRDHWTEPWGFRGQGLFLNRALRIATDMPPEQLMKELLKIENELGRMRTSGLGYTSRTVDIDVLLMDDLALELPSITLPHPLFHVRRFALAPAADVVPWAVHPVLGRTVLELLDDLRSAPQP